MAKDRQGVTHYTKGYAQIVVNFPNGEETCQNCEYCLVERYRAKCKLRHDAIIPLDCLDAIPFDCPLEFDFEKEI